MDSVNSATLAAKQKHMNPDKAQFLNLREKPARVSGTETSWGIGCNETDLPILAAKGILTPLNDYGVNTVKMYAWADIVDLKSDRKRLLRLTRAIYEFHHDKNLRRKGAGEGHSTVSKLAA